MSSKASLEKLSPSVEYASPPAGPGTVEDMQSDNLQYLEHHVVENMQQGGLQHQVEKSQYAENMQSGGLQYNYLYNPKDHSDKEVPPSIEIEKIDSLAELSGASSARRRIFGLPRRMFWLVAAVFILIAIGAVVGGAIAGTRKNKSNASSETAGSSAVPVGLSTSASLAAASTVTVVLSSSAGSTIPITLIIPLSEASKITSTPDSSSAAAKSSAAPSISSASTNPTAVSTASASTNMAASSAAQASSTSTVTAVKPARANPANSDGNYFVNCHNSSQVSSGMAYYKNLNPGSNVGQGPDDYVDVAYGSYVTWESGGAATFKGGVVVHWAFYSNVISAVNKKVGTADNTYEAFNVYRDAGEFLYSTDGWSCYAQYWAF